jgi:2,4-dienoyl-CoA reductase-like NADH-dependent reductase (Old Yellow Enzyme family)
MKPERVLLVDLNPTPDLSRALRGVVGPYFNVASFSGGQTYHSSEFVSVIDELEKTLPRVDPRLVFLTGKRDLLEKFRQFIASIKRVADNVPIVAAIDICSPEQAFELLREGASDFIL